MTLMADASEKTPYQVLARKYRPQNFDDLIGHGAMVKTLRNAFATGRIAHVYVLTGVRGVGFAALTYGQKATSDPAQVYTAVFGAAALGLVMFGLVVLIETVMMRNRPQEAIG